MSATQPWRRLFRGEWARLRLLVFIICFVALFSGFMPLLFALTTDTILPHGYRNHLLLAVAVVLALVVARGVLAQVQDYLFQKIRLRAERHMIARFVATVLALPDQVAADAEGVTGDSRLRLWLVNFQYQFSEILFFYAYAVFISIVVMAIIVAVDARIGLVVIAFGVLHYLNFRLHDRPSRDHAASYSEAKAALVSDVTVAIAGKRAINVARLDARILANLDARGAAAFDSAYRVCAIGNRQGFVQSLLRVGLFVLVLALSRPLVLQGELTTGGMFLIVLLISFAYEPIYRLNRVTAMASQLAAALRPLDAMLVPDTIPAALPLPAAAPRAVVMREICARAGGRTLFAGLDLAFEPGTVSLIRGPSGAGKSTLLDLVTGVRTPDTGTVRWGSDDPATMSQAQAAAAIAMATQETVVFEASMIDNVTMFAPDPDRARVSGLLARLGLADRADDLDSAVSVERFSLGERQRIGLARALYRDAPILLLDEPTANLDARSEALSLDAIAAAARAGRIVLLVSHGAAALRIADVVVDLGQGGVT